MSADLIDEDVENNAVRTFLMQYSCDRATTVGAMLAHMSRSGWRETAPPFALDVRPEEHLTKAGAQIWIRHLFSLEAAAHPAMQAPAALPESRLLKAAKAYFMGYVQDEADPGQGPDDLVCTVERHMLAVELEAAIKAAEAKPVLVVDARDSERLVDDLAALVRQLVRALSKANADSPLIERAMDYLKRKGLQGSPLRAVELDKP
jgi:hypothetical protein